MKFKILLIVASVIIGYYNAEGGKENITIFVGEYIKKGELIQKIKADINFQEVCIKHESHFNKEQFYINYDAQSITFVKTKEGVILC